MLSGTTEVGVLFRLRQALKRSFSRLSFTRWPALQGRTSAQPRLIKLVSRVHLLKIWTVFEIPFYLFFSLYDGLRVKTLLWDLATSLVKWSEVKPPSIRQEKTRRSYQNYKISKFPHSFKKNQVKKQHSHATKRQKSIYSSPKKSKRFLIKLLKYKFSSYYD